MALKDILQLVMNELLANQTFPDAQVRIGGSSKETKTTPPAIFWVPKRGTGSGPLTAMPRAVQLAYFAANPGKSIPRALHNRAIELEVHLWGGVHSSIDDFSQTEALIDATLSAIHHQMYGCYRYIGEEWIPSGTDVMALGRRCVLSLEINVPVLESPATAPVPGTPTASGADAVVVTSLPVTSKIGPIQPGGSTVTNP